MIINYLTAKRQANACTGIFFFITKALKNDKYLFGKILFKANAIISKNQLGIGVFRF